MLDAASFGTFVGALLPTFLVSRLTLWCLSPWKGGPARVLTAHVTSLVLIALIAGVGMANGGAFEPMRVASMYAFPQMIWLIIDQARHSYSEQQALSAGDGRIPPNPEDGHPPSPSRNASYTPPDRIGALERLSALRSSGALTTEEFEREKKRVLES